MKINKNEIKVLKNCFLKKKSNLLYLENLKTFSLIQKYDFFTVY